MAVMIENGVDTRTRILRSAENLFMEQGYAAISMSTICETCKVTKPGVYYHFQDKEDLYVQVVLGVMSRARGMLEAVAMNGDLPFYERVEATVRVLVLVSSQNMDQVRRDMQQHLKTEGRRERLERSFFEDMVGPIIQMMSLAHERGELQHDMRPEHASKALLALTSSFTERMGSWAVPVSEVPSMVTRILLRGFAAAE